MIADDQIGYGMKGGQLLFIANVARGLACGCVCYRCGKPLVAKKGSIRRHHFAHHEATDCHGAAESVLHSLAKKLIAELDVFEIPAYDLDMQRRKKTGEIVRHQARVLDGGTVRIDKVNIEKDEGDFVADIVIESGPKPKLLIVEVAVTHKVARPKLRKIRRHGLPAIEIRLETSDSLLSPESLKSKLQDELTSKVWLFHPRQREAEREFVSKFRNELKHSRITKVRRSSKLRRSPNLSFSAGQTEQERWAEGFNRVHGHYPSITECLRSRPDLFEKHKL